MERTARIGAVAQRYVDARKFSGIEWLVEHGGREIARGRAGLADALAGTPIPDGAIYRIYSMTKPIVTVMALILIEQGRLRLYDMLHGFDRAFSRMRVLLPSGELQAASRPITVEDLITHRAGFTYEFITGCHIAPLYEKNRISSDGLCSLEEMMARLAGLPLAFHPGSQFRYSVATDVLAHVLERASGRRIDELLGEFIFEPLGMNDTGYGVPAGKRARLMPMFGVADVSEFAPITPRPQELVRAEVEDMYPAERPDTFRRGGHGLFSTLDDYARFARMLLDGRAPDGRRILSRKMIEMMRANRLAPQQLPLRLGINVLPGYGFGFGVRVMMDPGQAHSLCGRGEFGWGGAATTYFWVDPHESMTGVIMTQYLASMLPLVDDMHNAAYQMLE